MVHREQGKGQNGSSEMRLCILNRSRRVEFIHSADRNKYVAVKMTVQPNLAIR